MCIGLYTTEVYYYESRHRTYQEHRLVGKEYVDDIENDLMLNRTVFAGSFAFEN